MLTGILVPTFGNIKVLGNEPYLKRKENAKKIGVVFGQQSQLWWDLPVKDSLELIRMIYKVSKNEFEKKLEVFSEVLNIDEFINTPVRLLSLGQRMRSDIAAALIHNPQILFLDEPTIGLDIVVKKQIREFIKKINKEMDVTVILTTHDMRDIEEICERTILIDNGKIIIDSDINDIKRKLGNINTLIVDFEASPKMFEFESNVKVLSNENNRLILSFDRRKVSVNDLILRCSSISPVKDIYLKEPDIEDIMRKIYSN
jgi:ABC-2 type transport system ATP-binding protein